MIDLDKTKKRLERAQHRGKEPITGLAGKGDGVTINATDETGESWTIWVRLDTDPEPVIAKFNPLEISLGTIGYDASLQFRRRNGVLYVIRPNDEVYAAQLGGALPAPNLADLIHTHEGDTQGGYLNASLVFNLGTVDEIYGGTGNSVYAVGDLLYASTTTVLSRLAIGANGNIYHVAGGVPVSGTLNLDTANLSGTLALNRGGTNADLSATGAGYLYQATAGANVANLKANFAGTVAPTVNEDSGDGYAIGSLWIDTTNDNIYQATDVSAGAAVWLQLNNTAGTSGWTDDGTVVRLTTSTDNVTIGSATDFGKLSVIGDTAADIQFRVRGATSQSAVLVRIEDDSANALFLIAANGSININESAGSAADLRVRGASVSALLYADVSAGAVGVGTDSPTARLHVAGTEDEVQFRVIGDVGQISDLVVVENGAGGDYFVVNSQGSVQINTIGSADGDLIVSGDTDSALLYTDASADRVGIGTNNPNAKLDVRGDVIFNDAQADFDFRWESDTNANGINADAGLNAVGFNTASPTAFITGGASTTAQASLRLIEGDPPTSPNLGDMWVNSARDAYYTRQGGMTMGDVASPYVQYTEVGNGNTTSAIPLIGGSVLGTATVASTAWFQGRTFLITAAGWMSTGNVSSTVAFTLALGGTTLIARTETMTVAVAGRKWFATFIVTCYTTGSSGTVFTQANAVIAGTPYDRLENTTTTTHNMTGNLAFSLTAQFGTLHASNAFWCSNLSIIAIA